VGFEEFGQRDDFNTDLLEQRLLESGAVQPRERGPDDSDDERERGGQRLRQGVTCLNGKASDDEDSDFE
jgi:hypothetical protein